MNFDNPVLLQIGAGLILLVLVGLRSHARRRRHLAEFMGGRRAVRRLSGSNLYRLPAERMILLTLAALTLAVAAAEPRWETSVPEPLPETARSVVIAIDVSASMQAQDVPTGRLGVALEATRELLSTLAVDRVGLLLFAGSPYALAPPTLDHGVLDYLLTGLTPAVVSIHDPGTRFTAALDSSFHLFGKTGGGTTGSRAIVILSDGDVGESEAAVLARARRAVIEGVTIHTIGVGTAVGAGMQLPQDYRLGGAVTDAAGVRAVSRLREPFLRQLAEAGGGRYAHSTDAAALRQLEETLADPPEQPMQQEAPPFWAPHDLTFWFAVAALCFLLVESLLDIRLPGSGLVRARGPV